VGPLPLALGAALALALAWLALRDDAPPPRPADPPIAEAPTRAPRADAPGTLRQVAPGRRTAAPPASPDVLVPGLLGEGEPWIDARGTPSRELVRTTLEMAIADHFPSHKLSEADVEVLTDAVLRLREARLALKELPETEDAAPQRRELLEEIEDAGRTFAEVMDMGLESFTAGAGGGVDRFDPREPVPAGEFLTEPR
jgi:hypothetical protein